MPLSGDVFIMLDKPAPPEWPQIKIEPAEPLPGKLATLYVTDITPWVHVRLEVIDTATQAVSRPPLGQVQQTPVGWEWRWYFTVPESASYNMTLFHDCDRGCKTWGGKSFSNTANETRRLNVQRPTKLCTVFPNQTRAWHGRSAWVVELTYAQQAESAYWGLDDLAGRVMMAGQQGHRVLLRIEYDQNQSMPPPDDEAALTAYLEYVRRLARDARFQGVYAFVIGSGFNSHEHNAQSPDRPVTPAWYARLFNGYGLEPTTSDNVLAVVRTENPRVRVLVGPVQPWVLDADGERPYAIDAPWLNYMNTLVWLLDEAAQTRAAAGISLAAPDGFAIDAPGNPDSPKMAGLSLAQEPQTDLISSHWHGAQLGFRIYRDWLDIINSTSTTRGLPIYIIASNTFGADATAPPAQNYPEGWLTAAAAEINGQPQVQSLCWFTDHFPFSPQWHDFSLTNPRGHMAAAAAEFEALLSGE